MAAEGSNSRAIMARIYSPKRTRLGNETGNSPI
jgi:hypothetical protein